MRINTKVFGEVEIDDGKIICFEKGIIGFPELTQFALMHDAEKADGGGVRWLQSLQEPAFAMPVMDPLVVRTDYNPVVEDEILATIGELNPEDLMIFTTIKVPADITKMTVNFKAPIVIHANTRKGCQVIAENDDHLVRQPVYEALKNAKERAGD